MNLDILSTTYGQTTFNIKLAHIVGLKTALYWSVLVDALFQAKKKNKVSEDGYFVLDRKYVYAMTTLTTPEQKECEKILTSLGYLENGTKVNSVRVDVGGIVKLITDDDEKQIEQIKNLVSKIVDVDKIDFYPIPKVDSVVLKLSKKDSREIDYNKFKKILKEAFQFKRKTIGNNITSIDKNVLLEVLQKHNYTLQSRAEELDLETFIDMSIL